MKFEPSAFTNLLGGGDHKDESDDEMEKQPVVPGLAMFLKNDAISSRNISSKNTQREKSADGSTVKTSVQNVPNRHNNSQSSINSASIAGAGPQNGATGVQTSNTGNKAFPVLTSADFLPTQNITANDTSGKFQGRNVSVSTSKSSLPPTQSTCGSSKSKLSMESQVSSVSESGFTGNIVQTSSGHKDSGLTRQGTGPTPSSSLCEILEGLSLSRPSSSASSTSTLPASVASVSNFPLGDSVVNSNIGTSSNFLFSNATPFPMPPVPMLQHPKEQCTPQNIQVGQPSFTSSDVSSSTTPANIRSDTLKPTTGTFEVTNNFTSNINAVSSEVSSYNVKPQDSQTVNSGLKFGNSLTQSNLILPAFSTATSSTNSGVKTTPSITAISQATRNIPVVSHNLSGIPVVGSLNSNFPKLSARDFSPSRVAGSSQKSATRRTLKPKKMIKK